MGIMKNALRERIRRKDFYIVAAIGLIFVLLCMSGGVTLSIDGVPVTDFTVMLPLVLHLVSVLGGAMAVALSLRTIPAEYERRTSHLIWIRGICQRKYHGQLALANMLSSVGALFLLYAAVMVFAGIRGETGILARSIPGFLLYLPGTAGISLMTSAFSLILPGLAAGVLATGMMLAGTMRPVLETVSGMVSGVSGSIMRVVLVLTPDLFSMETRAGRFLLGEAVDIHTVLGGLLYFYAGVVLLLLLRRKEA